MYTMRIERNNRTDYVPYNSLWAANLIAYRIIKLDNNVERICIVDNETGEITQKYIR